MLNNQVLHFELYNMSSVLYNLLFHKECSNCDMSSTV